MEGVQHGGLQCYTPLHLCFQNCDTRSRVATGGFMKMNAGCLTAYQFLHFHRKWWVATCVPGGRESWLCLCFKNKEVLTLVWFNITLCVWVWWSLVQTRFIVHFMVGKPWNEQSLLLFRCSFCWWEHLWDHKCLIHLLTQSWPQLLII